MPTFAELNNNLYCYRAKYIRVIDGDTIEVLIDHGMHLFSAQHLRLAGINAPEIFGVSKDSEQYTKGILVKDRLHFLLLSYHIRFGFDENSLFVRTFKDNTSFNRYISDVFIKTDVINNIWKNVSEILFEEDLVVKV